MALPLAAIPLIAKGLAGVSQIFGGKRMANRIQRPTYDIPPEFQQNVAIAEQMAQTGLPQQQYNNAANNIARNQAGALRAYGRSPRFGNITSILRATNDATMGLDAQDAGTRTANQRFAFGQRANLAQQKLQKQQWDSLQKYQEDADAAASTSAAGQQNLFGALSQGAQLGMLAGSDGVSLPGISGLFKKKQKPQLPGFYAGDPNMPDPSFVNLPKFYYGNPNSGI